MESWYAFLGQHPGEHDEKLTLGGRLVRFYRCSSSSSVPDVVGNENIVVVVVVVACVVGEVLLVKAS